jgi:hypothetical protein
MAFMALLVEGRFQIDYGAHVFIRVAGGAFFHGAHVVTVDAFSIVLLDVGLVVEPDLRQAMPGFFKWNNILHALVVGLDADMALLACDRSSLFFVAILAEIMKDYHL